MQEHPPHRLDAPIRSMIEFKQIIGRGTRVHDGKDYFTIWDFVKAHENFEDESGMVSLFLQRVAEGRAGS